MNYKKYFTQERKDFPKYINTVQMMKMCKISKNTIYKWLYSSEIKYERIFSIYRIERDSVLEYMYKKRNLQLYDTAYITKLKNFYTKEFMTAPDVLTNLDIACISGYSKSCINDWIAYGKIDTISRTKKNLIPKKYFIDFMVSKHMVTNNAKSDKHKQLLKQFEREVLQT